MKRLIIVGAGGHGKVIADIARKTGYLDIAFLDNDDSKTSCSGYPVIGAVDDAINYPESAFIIAIGNASVRQKLQQKFIQHNLCMATLVHPNAIVANDCILGPGTVVMAGAVINPGTTIGAGCIINTCSSVDHDCTIEDFVHVSVGAHIAGTVSVGLRSWISIGSSVINNVSITNDCMIGAGAAVVNDITVPGTYIGVPARLKTSTLK